MTIKAATAAADYAAREVVLNNQMKSEALGTLGAIGVGSLGIGAGIRGVFALSNLLSKNKQLEEDDQYSSAPTSIDIPVPVLKKPLTDEENLPPARRRATRPTGIAKLGFIFRPERAVTPPPASNVLARHAWENWAPPGRGAVGFIAGDNASSKWGIPWMWPAAAVAAGGGLYGGYKLTDWLLNKRQRAEDEEDLTDAKKRYQNALLAQYTPEQLEKQSRDNLSYKLDRLSQEFIKHGGLGAELGGRGLGLLALLTGTLAVGAGIGSYKYFKDRSPEERMRKALEQRARDRFMRRPPELVAVPQPVVVTKPKLQTENEEEEDQFKSKLASVIDIFKQAIAVPTFNQQLDTITADQQAKIYKIFEIVRRLRNK